jgi:hypothetical protein
MYLRSDLLEQVGIHGHPDFVDENPFLVCCETSHRSWKELHHGELDASAIGK